MASIGAVLLDPVSGIAQYFGAELGPEAVEASSRAAGQTQVIGQAELYPVLTAKHTWRKILTDRSVLFFIDNDAARAGLLKGYSPSLPSLKIIVASCFSDYKLGCKIWYARVPSGANVADSPSRLKVSPLMLKLGAVAVQPVMTGGLTCARVM